MLSSIPAPARRPSGDASFSDVKQCVPARHSSASAAVGSSCCRQPCCFRSSFHTGDHCCSSSSPVSLLPPIFYSLSQVVVMLRNRVDIACFIPSSSVIKSCMHTGCFGGSPATIFLLPRKSFLLLVVSRELRLLE